MITLHFWKQGIVMHHENLAALQRQMRQYQQMKEQESTLQRNIATMESMLPRLKEEADRGDARRG